MSSPLSVYVGPYLKCHPQLKSQPYFEKMMDLIGEGDRHGDWDLYGPTEFIKGVDRDLVFGHGETNKGSQIETIAREMALFEVQFAHDIREIRGDYDRVEVCWGIVPGYH